MTTVDLYAEVEKVDESSELARYKFTDVKGVERAMLLNKVTRLLPGFRVGLLLTCCLCGRSRQVECPVPGRCPVPENNVLQE
ncbi:hypothetical protein GCM10010359_50770 [Streptomyces morookaense]|nr:hypothetical protein GCM10010359_50770 [Streptomyces morookaense]